ncbi:MAG: TMEM165/GDT1 family protein [Syntrophobacterales bacterium]|jgi:putative Ca2+/H+ antiporter (TMEM165/GDT1 family)|nr:TMEM165/GDT1 family protein [Syntrophobacterales bacterium]
MTAYIASLLFVVLAEMGDKTQLLAMAFASRYRWQTVMWGVLVATLANHLCAALAGHYLTNVVPLHYVQIVAAASFILFGLWTLRGDKLNDEDKRFSFSPFWTVAVAFFFAEMGDKTQLATVALATKYTNVVQVWLGTTSGMLVADAIGIIVGIVLGKNIPERAVKWFAATIFIAFGIIGLYGATPKHYWTPAVITCCSALLLVLIYGVARLGKAKDSAEK